MVRVAAAVLGLAAAGEALAAAGWVDFAVGGATITDARGRSRAAAKGEDVDPGDTLRTGASGRVQIHFTDGAYVSLQPGSEFAVKDYNFDGRTDGSERGFFSLARGAMRAVTGLIGRVNRNRYQIATPTATIGIRGTGGRIEILGDGSTLVAGTSGIWTLSNAAGTIDVPAGAAGVAPSAPGEPPRQTDRQPSAGPAVPVAPAQFAAADQRTPTGDSASLCGSGALSACTASAATPPSAPPLNPNPPLVSGSPFLVAYSYGDSSSATPAGNNQGQNVFAGATFDSTGRMTGFSDATTTPPPTPQASFAGTHQEFGTAGGVMAWGRWAGPISGIDNVPGPGNTPIVLNPGANAGYHYVAGIAATAMPTAGSAAFNFIGATLPTGFDGTIAPGTFSGTFRVTNWATGSISVTANLAFASFGYALSGTGSFTAGSPSFAGSVSGTEVATPPSTYQCATTCSGTFNGAFYGPAAKFAGYTYLLDFGTSGGKISGAAAFGR